MKIRREIKVGVLAIVTVGLLVWGFSYLKGSNLLSSGDVYYAVYNKVDGLVGGEPVRINGLQIGRVESVEFSPKLDGTIIVKFRKQNDFPISKNAIAKISSLDLLGAKGIVILQKPGPLAISGDTLKSDVEASLTEEVNRQVLPIKKKAEDLLTSVDSVITYINVFFNQEARQYIAESFHSINSTFTKLDTLITTLDRVIQTNERTFESVGISMDSLGRVIRRNTKEIDKTVSAIQTISDTVASADVAGLINNLSKTLAGTDSIFQQINSNQGSLGKLVYDEELYINLAKASDELQALLKDMKLNPKRYVHFSLIGGRAPRYQAEP